MYVVRFFVFFSFVILLSAIVEFIRIEYQIPISPFDLAAFPLSLVVCFNLVKQLISKNPAKYKLADIGTKKLLLMFFVFSVIDIPVGVGMIWMGMASPLEFISGLKGGAHGYSFVSFGILLLMVWVYCTVLILRRL
ncbi:hypothetical protein [Marinobacter sp. ANT_B65]|uniref:hypothetical protein n=1 Tax=Marinobacter sp. ANT_B65 TaxID=2039467 RepID=UPI000BBED641|nr:hypothetical protein [Marinobacter sp. ANT_B65]PCM45860.1 hypothetical protein CPA50_07830 [Marinobacter sp. ANT_B65]